MLPHQNGLRREPSGNKFTQPKANLSKLTPQNRHNSEVTSQSPFSLWERFGHVGEQYQCLNPAVGCIPDGVMVRLTPPLQIHSLGWPRCWRAPAAATSHPQGAVARSPSVQQLVADGPDAVVHGLWSGAARALLQLRGAGSTPGSIGLTRGTAGVGAAADPRKGWMLLTSLGMTGSCEGSGVIHKMLFE